MIDLVVLQHFPTSMHGSSPKCLVALTVLRAQVFLRDCVTPTILVGTFANAGSPGFVRSCLLQVGSLLTSLLARSSYNVALVARDFAANR